MSEGSGCGVEPTIRLLSSNRRPPCCMQALQETFLVFRLAVLLYSYLGLGTRWTGKLTRLILYAMLLLPGFIQVYAGFRPVMSLP
jgi:hypothetical protein